MERGLRGASSARISSSMGPPAWWSEQGAWAAPSLPRLRVKASRSCSCPIPMPQRPKRSRPASSIIIPTSRPGCVPMIPPATISSSTPRPWGWKAGDPYPIDVTRLAPTTFVGEVVMRQEITPLLQASRDKGCNYQIGTDMLFEQIPALLEFFGFGTTTPDEPPRRLEDHLLATGDHRSQHSQHRQSRVIYVAGLALGGRHLRSQRLASGLACGTIGR